MSLDTHAEHGHHEHPDVVGSRNRLGVILIIVADVSFALGILFAYFYLRSQNINDGWLPKATEETKAILPVGASGAITVTAIAAFGYFMHWVALKGARAKNDAQLKLGGLVALLASVVALVLQNQQIANAPFTFHNGAYASCYYLITIMNEVHLILTVLIALGNWNRSRKGLYSSNYWHVEIVNIWWLWMVISSALGAFALSFN